MENLFIQIPTQQHAEEKAAVDEPPKLNKQRNYNKTFYARHKERMLKTKICGCGGKYSAYTLRKHERTKRHMNYLNKNN